MSLLPKSEQDCVFFLQGNCNKTDCEYRHCEPALNNFNVCSDWQNGKPCSKPNCVERHSNKHLAHLQGAPKIVPNPEIPCRFNQFCQRIDCMFKHTLPRLADSQPRPVFPRPMSMTFRPRPQTGGETVTGQTQPIVAPAESSNFFHSNAAQIRPPPVQKHQVLPSHQQPQVANRPATGKAQLQIAGLSQRNNQNSAPRPVQTQIRNQVQGQPPAPRPVRPTNKVRPMHERLSTPNGNKNAPAGNQNAPKAANQTKIAPAKPEKSRLRPPPGANTAQSRVIKLGTSNASTGSKFGDPLTLEQIRANKIANQKQTTNATSVNFPNPRISTSNTQASAAKVLPSKPIQTEAIQPTLAQNIDTTSQKRPIDLATSENAAIPSDQSSSNQYNNSHQDQLEDFSQFDTESFDLEPIQSFPEPKKARLETSTAQPETIPQSNDHIPSNNGDTLTGMDLDLMGDLGDDLDPDFLAELENY